MTGITPVVSLAAGTQLIIGLKSHSLYCIDIAFGIHLVIFSNESWKNRRASYLELTILTLSVHYDPLNTN